MPLFIPVAFFQFVNPFYANISPLVGWPNAMQYTQPWKFFFPLGRISSSICSRKHCDWRWHLTVRSLVLSLSFNTFPKKRLIWSISDGLDIRSTKIISKNVCLLYIACNMCGRTGRFFQWRIHDLFFGWRHLTPLVSRQIRWQFPDAEFY